MDDVSTQKRLPVREFVDGGYLQEVNRKFLHPLGLALEVTVAHEPSAMLLLRGEDLPLLRHFAVKVRELDPSTDAAMGALERLLDGATLYEPGDGYVSSVWDARDDPEGIIFEDGLVDGEKAAKVQDEFAVRALARGAALGYMIQPVADAGPQAP